MDPRKIVFVVLAAAFTVGVGELQATSSAGAQSETALPAGPDRDTVRSESELIDVLARAYRSMDLDLYTTLFANPHQHGVEFRFVRLGFAGPNSPEKRISLHDRHGPGDRHAHFLAAPGGRLFPVREKFETLFLGHLDGVFPGLLLDVPAGLSRILGHNTPDPSGVVMNLMVQFGWAIPAILIILFSTFSTTVLDIYSTAVSSLNIFPKLGERRGVLIGGILGTATALLFPTLLNYEHFLLFIGAMFWPLFGVVLVDYFLLRKEILELGDLYRKDGRYWFRKGLNPRALAAWAAGFALYLGFFNIGLSRGGEIVSS